MSRRPRARMSGRVAAPGFTLLEVLVVVAILALAGGLVVASIDRDERGTLEREARRFAGALEYAALRAQLRHETLGVSTSTGGGSGAWRFWRRASDGRWQALSDDEPLAPHALPAAISVAPIAYAGRAFPPDTIVPLRASGRNEPYAFALSGEGFEAVVRADPLNRVAIDGPHARTR